MKFMRFLAMLSVMALMAMGFAGCGGGSKTDELFIGGIGPLTGEAATYGTAVRNGAMLAVNEINAAGGINGFKIRFEFEDDAASPDQAVSAYNALMDKGMQILMGTVTSGACIAVAEQTKDDNVFQLTPSASAVEAIKHDNAFRVCFNDPNQGIGVADYIKENNLASKIGIIYNASDPYSTGIYNKFKERADEIGLNIVATESFSKDTSVDFKPQLQKMKDLEADLVFLPIYYEAAASILIQARDLGLETKFFGCDGLDGVIEQLGENKEVAEGVMLLTPFAADAEDQKTKDFVAAYKAAYNDQIPNQFAADGYDAIYTIKAAAEKAGIKADMSASEICELMKKAMTEITVEGVTGKMTWSKDGEPTKSPKAVKIENGAYTAL